MSHEVSTLMEVHEVNLICDCNGRMTYTGLSRLSYPPQYEHMCNRCNKIEFKKEKYPLKQYKIAENK